MTRAQSIAAAALSLATVLGRPTAAQSPESDSLSFRRGQWALETSFGYGSLGLLRFLSPRSAIVLDVSGSLQGEKRRSDDNTENRSTYSAVALQIGRRVYRPVTANAATLFSTGVALSRYEQDESYMTQSTSHYGLFAEAGGAWFPSRRISIQVTATSVAAYTRGRTDYKDNQFVGDQTSTGYAISPVSSTVSATFYFR